MREKSLYGLRSGHSLRSCAFERRLKGTPSFSLPFNSVALPAELLREMQSLIPQSHYDLMLVHALCHAYGALVTDHRRHVRFIPYRQRTQETSVHASATEAAPRKAADHHTKTLFNLGTLCPNLVLK